MESAENIDSAVEDQEDGLLSCLKILCEYHQHAFSARQAMAGLPLDNEKLTPQLLVRAADQIGLEAKIVKREFKKIDNLVLPIILLLDGKKVCVLKHKDKKNCEIIFPEYPNENTIIEKKKLAECYSGYAIYVKPKSHFEKRASQYNQVKETSWFWGIIFRQKATYIQVAITALLINLFALVSPLFVMNVYDRVVPNNAMSTLWVLALGAGIAYSFDFLLRSIRGSLIDNVGKKADVVLSGQIFKHILSIKLAGKPASSGAFANNLREFEVLREFFTSATMTALVDLPFLVLFLTVIGFIGGSVVWVPVAAIPIVILLAVICEIPMRRSVEKSGKGGVQKHAILVEAISSLEAIKCLAAESKMQKKWESAVASSSKAGMRSRFFSQLAINLTMYVQLIVSVVTVVVGVVLIGNGELTMGGLIACTILSGRALAPLAQITNLLTRLEQAKMALKSLNKLMDLPTERPKDKQFIHREKFKGEIEFKNIDFHYPNQDVAVLKNINLHIAPGERVGIIGRIGSGKSTVQKLMMGLHEPSNGSILIDGVDLAQIDPADLRKNMGYVSQDSNLFYGTVRENMVMAAERVSDEQILKAAHISGVENFVKTHPLGYDLQIGERGEGLSGGQQQAICIGRALLLNAPFLFLDEPTSSMDNTTEHELLVNLPEVIRNRTLVLVTHRASLLSLVDRVIVMEAGHIVTDGPKDKVLSALAQKKQKG